VSELTAAASCGKDLRALVISCEWGPPIAAGLFKPDPRGSATVVNPPLPEGVEDKTFAVTLEPESGSHQAPRGTAVIVGAGE
jgi:anti-sigma-K factor RskA